MGDRHVRRLSLGFVSLIWAGTFVVRSPLTCVGFLLVVLSPSLRNCLALLALASLELAGKTVMGAVADLVHGYSARYEFLVNRQKYILRRLHPSHPLVHEAVLLTDSQHRIRIVQRFISHLNKTERGPKLHPLNVYRAYLSSETTAVPAALASYSGINSPSYIFIYDDPEKSVLARFLLYHEMAHVGRLAPDWSSMRFYESSFATLIVLWFVHAPSESVLLCSAWLSTRVLARLTRYSRLLEEGAADTIAMTAVWAATHRAAAIKTCCGFFRRSADFAVEHLGFRAGFPYARASRAEAVGNALMNGRLPNPGPQNVGIVSLGLAVLTISAAFRRYPPIQFRWHDIIYIAVGAGLMVVMYRFLLGFVMGMASLMRYDINPKAIVEPESDQGELPNGGTPVTDSAFSESDVHNFLKAVNDSRYEWRSMGGLCSQTGMSRDDVASYLSVLRERRLLWQYSPQGAHGRQRWCVDTAGYTLLYPGSQDWESTGLGDIIRRGIAESSTQGPSKDT